MACDAATLEALQSANGYPELSRIDVLMCLAAVYGAAAGFSTAAAALNQAAANGYFALSDDQLDQCYLAAIC